MSHAQPPRFVPSLRSVLLGAIASVALFSATTPAFAGTKEADAVRLALPPGVTFLTATGAQLSAAVTTAAGTKPKGVFLGEALRNATQDVGAGLAAGITDPKVAAAAIKTAGSGKTPNVTNVPNFSRQFTAGVKTATIALAELVTSTKAGVGAVLGGFASSLPASVAGDTERLTLLNSSRKLLASVQQIAQFVGVSAFNPVTFASQGATADSKNAVKILTGVSAAKPTQAGAIVEGSKTLVASKAALFAKGVGAVVDIEQVQKVGVALASVVTKSSALIQVAGALGKAIAAKPTTTLGSLTNPAADGSATPSNVDYRNRLSNKVDELGELAAYMLNAGKVANLADFADGKKASKFAFGLISSIVKSAKLSAASAAKAGTPVPDLSAILSYVYGSVVLTLKGYIVPPIPGGINAALTDLNDPSKLKGLAGLDGKTGLDVAGLQGLWLAATVAGTRFENGGVAQTTGVGGINLTDPETNTRSF